MVRGSTLQLVTPSSVCCQKKSWIKQGNQGVEQFVLSACAPPLTLTGTQTAHSHMSITKSVIYRATLTASACVLTLD